MRNLKLSLKKMWAAVAKVIDMRDAFVFGGLLMLSYGAGQIYAPAAWIIAGGFFMLQGLRR